MSPNQTSPETPRSNDKLLVVGLGASAGGLEALEEFFQNMPGDSGMAFVVVTHQHPGRVSLMPELLARRCAMTVVQVDHDTPLEPNHVYLAPPGSKLEVLHDTLYPSELSQPRHMPIDGFFRSLAQDAKERAIGIVLSGTGTDGTLGLKEIKGVSGMTMVQEETSARYAGMPHSAIAGLQVDYVLPPSGMPAQLIAYAHGMTRRASHRVAQLEDEHLSELLARVFLILRTRTGHDFSYYKSTTIRRRIERRMNVHQIEAIADYVRLLQASPIEIDRLFKELLIGVTSFFRDPDAFECLQMQALPELIDSRPDNYVLRVWVPGCSTGEEAYSLAILVRETIEQLKRSIGVQIFATDLDADAIDYARQGIYPESIAADITATRLERFFIHSEGTYRVKKDLRDMLVFAVQNVIEDPPFTKLDLLSCRNLLIYLEGKLQQRLLPIFHYALRPGGVLLLGTSETVGTFTHLFSVIDKKWKIFRRSDVAPGTYVTEFPASFGHEPGSREPPPPRKGPELGLGQAAQRVLLQFLTPPAVLMHERGDIVHIHGRTGLFLEPAPGAQIHANIYNMARDGLQLDLALAVRHAASSGEHLQRGVKIRANGGFISVDLRVKHLEAPDVLCGLYLVAFEHAEPVPEGDPQAALEPPVSSRAPEDVEAKVNELRQELQHIKEVHQSTIEELETANEELKSTNEELQSTNEELQSANEELETSKEEMQSLNEELQTVNAELQGKVEELSRANDDMKNLLNGTDIATVFLDSELNIKRYTEQARRVIRLIPSDIGRSIRDLVSNLRYTSLVDDAHEVLRTLVYKELEVESEEGAWYFMRILPYRTTENVIDGLVLTFVDITRARELQEQNRHIINLVRGFAMRFFAQNSALRYEWVSGELYGQRPEVLLGRSDEEVLPAAQAAALTALKRRVLSGITPLHARVTLQADAGHEGPMEVYLSLLLDERGQAAGVNGFITPLDEGSEMGDLSETSS